MTLRNPVDDDRLKLFPRHQHKEYLRQCDMRDGGCNDAELVAEMRREGTLKVLDPDEYGVPDVRVAAQPKPELLEGFGLRRGDTITVLTRWPWGDDNESVIVWSIGADGSYIRTDSGRVFAMSCVNASPRARYIWL